MKRCSPPLGQEFDVVASDHELGIEDQPLSLVLEVVHHVGRVKEMARGGV